MIERLMAIWEVSAGRIASLEAGLQGVSPQQTRIDCDDDSLSDNVSSSPHLGDDSETTTSELNDHASLPSDFVWENADAPSPTKGSVLVSPSMADNIESMGTSSKQLQSWRVLVPCGFGFQTYGPSPVPNHFHPPDSEWYYNLAPTSQYERL